MRPSATIALSFRISRDGGLQKIAAGVDLGRRRLVLRRHAAHRVGDARVDELEPVVDARSKAPSGEAVLLQRRIEQIAGVIAGERPPGAVGAAQPRCEADDQERALTEPNDGTGALNHSGSRARQAFAKRQRVSDSAGNRGRLFDVGQP